MISCEYFIIVLGFMTYAMFMGEDALKQSIHSLLNLPVNNHVVVLLYGCSGILKNAIHSDGNRAAHRTIIMESESFSYPKVTFISSKDTEKTDNLIKGYSGLLTVLENFSYTSSTPNLLVQSDHSCKAFDKSMIPIESINSIYDVICMNYAEVKAGTDKNWGTEKQWKELYSQLKQYGTLSGVICHEFGGTSNLSMMIEDGFEDVKSSKAWLLWLAMKVFGTKENSYLTLAVKKSSSVKDLIELIYMELLNHKHDSNNFPQLYRERKHLIEKLREDLSLIQKYCDHVGQYAEDAVYYLTDNSYKEQRAFLYYLGKYEYSESDLMNIVKLTFPVLDEYLGSFEFNERNTKNPTADKDLLPMLTKYFHDYKLQKICNRIDPEFMSIVEENAILRPFTKLLPRISIVKDIDKSKAQIHFFDALGVEYLAYIISRCNYYGLQPLVHIGHCELPSITKINKDFVKFFKLDLDENDEPIIPGTKDLDKLKHHSRDFDYRKCKEPVHLFFELKIIDEELRKIRELLIDGKFDKIILISDHGASRLSVIHQTECEVIKMENKGEESGRCCPVSEDPNIPNAIYENGYAILANYDRFRGGRAANVEVHGGASLEETVIPIIELSLKPEEMSVYIVNTVIEFHNKEVVSVVVHSNIALQSPKLIVRGLSNTSVSYECDCTDYIDAMHYRFDIPEIKRSGSYVADLYDDDQNIQQNMRFETKKAIGKTNDLFS